MALVASPSYGQVAAPKAAADVAGTPSATVMPPAYVELVARMAYLWGWPLVNNLNRSIRMKDVPEPGRLGGVVPASPPATSRCSPTTSTRLRTS
jgi:hypothetical protein